MPRATNAPASRKRRSRRLKLARGFYGARHRNFRTATEAVDKAQTTSYAHRRTKKRDYRRLWTSRISIACRDHDMRYSEFIAGLAAAGVELNRKMLSEIAIHDPAGFDRVVDLVKPHVERTAA